MTNELCVLILNYNTADLTFQCINSLIDTEENIKFKIIIVDNGSSSDELTKLINIFENNKQDNEKIILFFKGNEIILLLLQNNLGFSAGNNVGLKYIYHYLCPSNIAVINSDIIFYEKNTFYRLIEESKRGNNVGVVMPIVWNVYHRIEEPEYQIQIRKRERNMFDVLVDGSPLIRKIFSKKFNDNMYKKYMPWKVPMQCEVVSGACFLMLSDFAKFKFLFDEGVFLYHEEYMLSSYLEEKELKSLFIPSVRVKHLQGMSGEKKENFSLVYYNYKVKSQIYYLRKYLRTNEFNVAFFKVVRTVEGILYFLILNKKFEFNILKKHAISIFRF